MSFALTAVLSVIVCMAPPATAFFFGGGGGGGGGGCSCGSAPPPCPSSVAAPCPAAPLPQSCAPQPSCGGYGGGFSGSYSDGGGGAYASPPISSGQYATAGAVNGPVGGASYAIGGGEKGPSYATGPQSALPPLIGSPQQSGGYVSGPQSGPSPPLGVQVAPASYATGQAAAGQRLQEVEDELDEQMMAEAKAEDSALSASENSVQETDAQKSIASTGLNATVAEVMDPIDVRMLNLTDDSECNSEELRKIVLDNITEDLNTSKRVIQLAAEARFGGRFDVICSNNDFSYVTNTELYCQDTKQLVSCYAYRQL